MTGMLGGMPGGMLPPWAALAAQGSLGSMPPEMIQQLVNSGFGGIGGMGGMSLDPSKIDPSITNPFAPPIPNPGMGSFSQPIPGMPGSGKVPGSRLVPPGGFLGEYPKELLKIDDKKQEPKKTSEASGLEKEQFRNFRL